MDFCLSFSVMMVQCFACYPKAVPENLLGLGLSTGKVLLTSFVSDPQTDPTNLIGAEFPPKHSRLCTSLAWNVVDSKLVSNIRWLGSISLVRVSLEQD